MRRPINDLFILERSHMFKLEDSGNTPESFRPVTVCNEGVDDEPVDISIIIFRLVTSLGVIYFST
jgi:hypothetical protein